MTILRKFLQILTVLKRFQKISNIQKFSKYFMYFYVKITSESPSFLPWLYFISHMFCSVIEILWKLSLKKLLKSNLLMCITDKKFPKKNQNGDFVGIWTFGLRYYPILQNIKKLYSEKLEKLLRYKFPPSGERRGLKPERHVIYKAPCKWHAVQFSDRDALCSVGLYLYIF